MASSLHLNLVLGHSISLTFNTSSSGLYRSHNNLGMVVRCAKSGEPLRRPSPPAAPSTLPLPPSPPQAEFSAPSTSAPPAPPSVLNSKVSGTTIEYQRQRAKEMQEYFLDKKFQEETFQSRIFGWTQKNEIANGRWVMFGLAVGLLTEYATGADFVEQLKIIISNLGIADVD